MTLAPHHYAMLHDASAIADEIIAQRGYQTVVHPDGLRALGFSQAQARTAPALAIPLWNVSGQQHTWQIRPDRPRATKDGRAIRYETPKGGRVSLDAHPALQPLLGNPSVPLAITEGIRKADSLVSRGLCTIGLMGGVWGFRGANEFGAKVILPAWDHVGLNGRDVYIIFDSDLAAKAGVQAALAALIRFLHDRQACAYYVEWRQEFCAAKCGADDFFAQGHSLDELRGMLVPAGPQAPTPRQRRARSREHIRDEQPWRRGLEYTQTGMLRATYFNVGMFLRFHPDWQETLWLDELRNQMMWKDQSIDDALLTRITQWFGERESLPLTQTRLVRDCLYAECAAHRRDLLKEAIMQLQPWDGRPRLDTWLAEVAGTASDAYGQAVSRLLPVSMIARALRPGELYRFVVILQGPQEAGKSDFVRILASDQWYGELMQDLESKEAQMRLAGKWVIELPELHALSRTQETKLKAFLTLREDVYIPKYSNAEVRHPRRCIFVGTTNQHAYLRDPTGNTRYLPIETGEHINTDALAARREQLLAEALIYYKNHPADWWRLSDEAFTLATDRRDAVHELNVYEERLAQWIPGFLQNPRQVLTWDAIAEHCLQIRPEGWKDKALQAQVTAALQRLGYRRGNQVRLDGKPVRPWTRATPDPAE